MCWHNGGRRGPTANKNITTGPLRFIGDTGCSQISSLQLSHSLGDTDRERLILHLKHTLKGQPSGAPPPPPLTTSSTTEDVLQRATCLWKMVQEVCVK